MTSHPSPKERLTKLFRRSGDKSAFKTTDPPHKSPASPSNDAVSRSHVRHKSSKTSLRDLVSGKRKSRLYTSDDVPEMPAYGAQVAAATAMGVEDPLPGVPPQNNLSNELQKLNFNDGSERLTERNVRGHPDTQSSQTSRNRLSASPELHSKPGIDNLRDESLDQGRPSHSKPVLPDLHPYSGSVADWNIAQSDPTSTNGHQKTSNLDNRKSMVDDGRRNSQSSPLGRVKQAQESLKATTRRPVSGVDRGGSGDWSTSSPISPARASMDSETRGKRRSGLQKPLPTIAAEKCVEHNAEIGESHSGLPSTLHDNSADPSAKFDPHSELGKERGYLVKDAAAPVSLAGIVDLSNSEDTTLHERWAPAVTHETVIKEYHEIQQQQITREIHQDHIFHRTLPIIDIEVKPARHFIPIKGGYAEVAAEELPGRTGDNAQWLIAELASKGMPPTQKITGPRQFTARKFEGSDGDYKETTAPEGHPKTEQWWVHPPRLETGAEATGQTYPFHFDADNPRDNGLRAVLPEGEVVGTSEVFARHAHANGMSSSGSGMANGDVPPPVPQHREMPGHGDQSGLRSDTISPRFV